MNEKPIEAGMIALEVHRSLMQLGYLLPFRKVDSVVRSALSAVLEDGIRSGTVAVYPEYMLVPFKVGDNADGS